MLGPFFCARVAYIEIMAISLHPARPEDLPALSDLCMRSKAYWGYDATFMAACVEELTITRQDLETTPLVTARNDGALAGVAQIGPLDGDADLLKLFVDPPFMGHGIGRVLFDWCKAQARAMGAARLMIEADPNAAPFYERMGAHVVGTAPSGSIPGRLLPLLELPLR